MSVYIVSDIHGSYKNFMELLKKINFGEKDALYVIGDIVDRGPGSCRLLIEMMKHPNIICIAGNHEVMALTCLKHLMKEVTEESLLRMDKMIEDIMIWRENGGAVTMEEFSKLGKEQQYEIIDYMESFSLFEELSIGEKEYILVHAGLRNFSPDRLLDEYELEELVWDRPDYNKIYFEDIILVTGHTPTQMIEGNEHPGEVYFKNNHLAVDCGAGYGGRLAIVCLDTMDIFYSN